jgi:hypothetical protein
MVMGAAAVLSLARLRVRLEWCYIAAEPVMGSAGLNGGSDVPNVHALDGCNI